MAKTENESTCIALISDSNYLEFSAFLCYLLHKRNSVSIPKIFVLTIDVTENDFNSKFKNIEATQIPVDLRMIRGMGVKNWNHVSISTYAKILIPQLLPDLYTKCIYMDIDVYPLRNIDALINFPLHSPVAGTQFANGENRDLFGTDDATYFSTGLMILDLIKWRSNDFTVKLMSLLESNPLLLRLDSDLINLMFKENWQPLPLSFNYMAELALNGYLGGNQIDPMIIHFVGSRKPWTLKGHTIWHQQWRKEYLEFNPDGLKLSRADKVWNKGIRIFKETYIGSKVKNVVPRRLKDMYLKRNEA